MSDPRPPIPATCAARPTVGGLVSPYANVQLAGGGVDFRSQHESRVQRCWRETLCQLCGTAITALPIVLFGGPRQVAALQFDEPPLHPACAVYVSKACPMVAGRQLHYATGDTVSDGRRGDTCPDPECDCGGWVPTPGLNRPAGGDPAHDWFAVYVNGYSLAITEDRPDRVHSAIVDPQQVLHMRHVSTPGIGRTWTLAARTLLDEVHT